MARTRTLAQLRTEALQVADMENSSFVGTATNGEVDRYINEGISELYDLILESAGQEWFLRTAFISVTPAARVYNLPTNFYIIKGVDVGSGPVSDGAPNPGLLPGAELYPMRPYMFDERHLGVGSWDTERGWAYGNVRYRMYGEHVEASGVYTPKIRFTPAPTGNHDVVVWYIPHAPVLDADADIWDGFNGWEEYAVIYAAVRMMEKEESDSSHLHVRLERMRQRIQSLAGARDQGYPERVQDIDGVWSW